MIPLMLSLALLAPAPPPSPLTLDEVVAKYAAARGGLERWQAVSSLEMTGIYASFSEEAPFTLRRQRPNLYRFESAMVKKPTVLAHDGRDPWLHYPMYEIMKPVKAEDPLTVLIAQDAEFEPALIRAREKGHKVELDGRGDVDGQETVRLKVTRADGWEETWHLDPKTWLEVAVDSKTFDYTQRGEAMKQRAFFSDFRTVDGLVIPHRVEKEYGARLSVLTVDKVRLNPPLDEASFKMPAPSP